MINEKIEQAINILKEEDIDCWLTFVRESSVIHDPVLDLIAGANVTWHSAFILTRSGEKLVIVGSLDKANQEAHGYYKNIEGYVQSIEESLRGALSRIDPKSIAINYSLNSSAADGLTYGMYLQLQQYLKNTVYGSRLVSAEPVINKLRGRKSAGEKENVRAAIRMTLEMFDKVGKYIRPGKSEREIASFLSSLVDEAGVEPAWDEDHCPAVFTGPDSAGAHAGPTDRKVESGQVLNIDFGVKLNEYCSDLQRSWYILKPGEDKAPENVRDGFRVIIESISLAAQSLKPGLTGFDIDKIARDYITTSGYDEYPHALGHQIGRSAHDGGGLLAPKWERYGSLPDQIIEKDQLYTIEPRLKIEGHGIATIEEIVAVTATACEFLSPRQEDIYLISS